MHPYIALAKLAVENYVKEGRIINSVKNLPEDLSENRAGVFVTIKRDGQLRGCIGTYLPTKENIAKEIISNAIAAATEDYRFPPVQKEDLPYLSYEVYVLSKPEFVKNQKDLDPKKYGIIVKTLPIPPASLDVKHLRAGISAEKTDVVFDGHLPSKTGLLLPDLEGVETIEQQILIACQKGDIDRKSENILIYRFSVKKYE